MPLEDVTVSLSRLALAKAIKTADGEDEDPWSKSVIFHQAHINQDMRNSIVNPQSNGQAKMKAHTKNIVQQRQPPQKTQMIRVRSSEKTQVSASSSMSSLQNPKPVVMKNNRIFVPSDDEEEEEDEDEDSEEDEPVVKTKLSKSYSDFTLPKLETGDFTLPKLDVTSPKPDSTQKQDKGKAPKRTPQPSDDEDDSEDSDEDESDEETKEIEPPLYARRMSTLRQLERGPSLRRRAKSTGDFINDMQPPPPQLAHIDQWRMYDSPGTPRSTISSTTPSEDLIEEPILRVSTPSNMANYPRSTSDLDMYNGYFHQQHHQQQQQVAYNLQMQQMMQMQQMVQAQQMAQIQQYQQAMQMQQQQKTKNRKSVSGMDLMMQLEEEKASMRKNKKRIPDPSKANLADGLMSQVNTQKHHNINFQHMAQQQQLTRASKSDFNINQERKPRNTGHTNRPASTMMYYDPRMSMMRSESSPIPTASTSTPIHQQPQPYLMPPMMQQHTRSNQHQLPPQQRRLSNFNVYK